MTIVAITGGARGIGLATARAFAAQGARVAIGDLDEVALAAARPHVALTMQLDVTSADSFREFIAAVERELGPLDVLVNNAGIMPTGALLDEEDRTVERIYAVNTLAMIRGTKLAARTMVRRGQGHIVNLASMAGEACLPGIASYCGSKAAVLAFTDAARAELAGTGVRLTAMLPAFVDTELTAGTSPLGAPKIRPEQVAAAIVDAVQAGHDKVYVPRAVGLLVRAARMLPRRVIDRMAQAVGGDQVFLARADASARAAYERRIRG